MGLHILLLSVLCLQGYFTNYPKHVFLILTNEFCERFSYYGLRGAYRSVSQRGLYTLLGFLLQRNNEFDDEKAGAVKP